MKTEEELQAALKNVLAVMEDANACYPSDLSRALEGAACGLEWTLGRKPYGDLGGIVAGVLSGDPRTMGQLKRGGERT